MSATNNAMLVDRPSDRRPARLLHRATLLPLCAFMLTGCDGVLTTYVLDSPEAFEFTIDSQSGLVDMASVTREDLLDALDLPSDAVIQEVDIQSVRLELAPGQGNAATTSNLSFTYLGQDFATAINVPVVETASGPVDQLVANVVNVLRANVSAMLTGEPGAPGSIVIGSQVSGIAPSGARLVLDGTLQVTFSATVTVCKELSLGPFGVVEDEVGSCTTGD